MIDFCLHQMASQQAGFQQIFRSRILLNSVSNLQALFLSKQVNFQLNLEFSIYAGNQDYEVHNPSVC